MVYPTTDNAPVYWEAQMADGNWFSLHTKAWSVKSFGGRRWVSGPKRGDDILLPHRRGRLWVKKLREAQNYDLNMWVFPTNMDGSKDANKTIEQKAHENFRKIVMALDQEGQFQLRKRWHEDDSTRADFGLGNNVKSAIAMAEYLDASGPDTDDGRGFYMNVNLRLTDPYFYSSVASQAVGTVTIEGEAPTDHIVLSIQNAVNPKVTFKDGNYIQYLGTVGATPLIINCLAGTAKIGTTYYNGLISRNPNFPSWGFLFPGVNNLTYTGGGTATFTYDAAYR